MHMRIDAMKVAAAVLTASNCRETLTNSKGVSMETVENTSGSKASNTKSTRLLMRMCMQVYMHVQYVHVYKMLIIFVGTVEKLIPVSCSQDMLS